jgi:outer membrane protein OmpA-like peptidoglycan-associated protein
MNNTSQAIRIGFFILVFGIAAGLMLGGCGTTRTAALQNAQSFYSQTQADPMVAQNAPVALHQAGETLKKAEAADNEERQKHLAGVAEIQTRQAIAEAQDKVARNEFQQLSGQREEILAQAREQEAAQARSQAQMSQQQAEQAQQQATQARQEASQLRQELEGLQTQQTERGVVLTLSDIYFKVDKSNLAPGAALNLSRLADFLRKHPDQKVIIEGHTDSTGSAGYNMQLSQQRANSVKEMLVANGVNPDQITTKGYGESFPVASNTSTAGRQQNRRVDVVILPGGAA